MKISLVYPKIPENKNVFLNQCVAFEKYDGTNLHWCWNKNDGWNRFGTRRTQFFLNKNGIEEFCQTHSELAPAPTIFNDNARDSLTKYFIHSKAYCNSNIIVFTEFYGPSSFAGNHSDEDAKCNSQKLVIIDISVNDNIISPSQLRRDFNQFGKIDLAKVIYIGKYTGQFVEDVRKGKYSVNEGVVVKGIVDGEVFMTKIKTNDYLKRLRAR